MQYDLSGFSLEQLKIIKKEIEVEIKNRDSNFKDKFKKEIEINIFNNTNFIFLLNTYGFNNKYNSGNEIPLNIIEDINSNIDLFLSKFEKNSDIVKKDLKIEILPNINKFMNFIHCGGGYSLNRCAMTFRSLYEGKSIEEAFSPNSQNWINDLKLSENKGIYKNSNLTFDNLINFIKNELNTDIKIKLILDDKEHLFEINDINSLIKNEISF